MRHFFSVSFKFPKQKFGQAKPVFITVQPAWFRTDYMYYYEGRKLHFGKLLLFYRLLYTINYTFMLFFLAAMA